MSDIPELSDEQFESAIPARLRNRFIRGTFDSGQDIVALRSFIRLTQAEFARAIGIIGFQADTIVGGVEIAIFDLDIFTINDIDSIIVPENITENINAVNN